MSLLSRLFGRGGGRTAPRVEPEAYEGFAIYPEPVAEAGRWRIAARIDKEVGGEMRSHRLIRADVLDGRDAAMAASVAKAKALIDEQGERIFD